MAKYIVRYGSMRMLGAFDYPEDKLFARGTKVIARTSRGLEAGEILCEATDEAFERLHEAGGRILREMTADDARDISRLREHQHEQFATCQQCIQNLGLAMELVDLEHLFGGERIIVYYLAEGRVDFRELVRMLAGEFQTRIEMRQIGVRDEAKLMADYGDCGKSVCCNTHLIEMPPVSMKMAKLQKATLDPTKISGRCGRLKCCLRYEYDVYEQLQKELPPIGSTVTTAAGPMRVLAHEILAGRLLVEDGERVRHLIDVADVGPATKTSPREPADKTDKPK
ncbi:MAG: signal peptidase [Pirellulaceae bacterium]|nr:signal peptidase [Pirellulaceae bacterium]